MFVKQFVWVNSLLTKTKIRDIIKLGGENHETM